MIPQATPPDYFLRFPFDSWSMVRPSACETCALQTLRQHHHHHHHHHHHPRLVLSVTLANAHSGTPKLTGQGCYSTLSAGWLSIAGDTHTNARRDPHSFYIVYSHSYLDDGFESGGGGGPLILCAKGGVCPATWTVEGWSICYCGPFALGFFSLRELSPYNLVCVCVCVCICCCESFLILNKVKT